ncbi:CGGC domain-containing protein [Dehalobacter restrictus]|uniref:CGGC domain-containing protein n=1 Tax=Dehalobacter restrictus TaxID=55583 RepID=UPI00339039AE
MRRIGIFCCSKITQKLGCSCAQCLYDIKNRMGTFDRYTGDTEVELAGLVHCPGCPSEISPERLANQIKNLTEYQVDEIHFTNCMNTFCVFRYDYQALIERDYPEIEVILGTGRPHITHTQVEIGSNNN